MGDQPRQREALLSTALKDLLDQRQHPVLIEVAVAQIRVRPIAQLGLAARLCRGHIDAGGRQPPEVFLMQRGIDDMESLLAALESFPDEWRQHPILPVRAVKEGADVTVRAKHGAGEANRWCARTPRSPAQLSIERLSRLTVIIGRVHMGLLSV